MQRLTPLVSSVVPRDVRIIIEYAVQEHPQGLDPLGTAYTMDSTGFYYTRACYVWKGYQILFRWDDSGFWVVGQDSRGEHLPVQQRLAWPWPMDPQDRIEATLAIDAIHQSVLDSQS